MRDLTGVTLNELYEIAAFCKASVSGLEARGAAKTVEQTRILKDTRAELRRIKAEIKRRNIQLPLF